MDKRGPVPYFNWSDNQTSFQSDSVRKNLHIHAGFEQEVVKRERPEHQPYKRSHIKERSCSWIHLRSLISPFPSALFISRMNKKRHSWVPSHKLCKHFLFCCTLTHRLVNNKELSARRTDTGTDCKQATCCSIDRAADLSGTEVSAQRQANTPTCEQRLLTG